MTTHASQYTLKIHCKNDNITIVLGCSGPSFIAPNTVHSRQKSQSQLRRVETVHSRRKSQSQLRRVETVHSRRKSQSQLRRVETGREYFMHPKVTEAGQCEPAVTTNVESMENVHCRPAKSVRRVLMISIPVCSSLLRRLTHIIIIINPLTSRVVGAPQMILQPVFSIFPCSPLPSGTCRTPGLSIP